MKNVKNFAKSIILIFIKLISVILDLLTFDNSPFFSKIKPSILKISGIKTVGLMFF